MTSRPTLDDLRDAVEAGSRLAESLNVESHEDRALLRRAVISSNVRLRKYDLAVREFRATRGAKWIKRSIEVTLITLFGFSLRLLSSGSTFHQSTLSIIATGAFVIVIAVLPTAWSSYSSFNSRVERVSGQGYRPLVILVVDVALLLSGIAFLTWQLWFHKPDSLLISPTATAYFVAILLINDWAGDTLATLLLFPRRHRARPMDRALIDIVRVARYAELWKDRWYDAPRSRTLVSELEAAARRIETVAWRTRRVGLLDRRTRSDYRRDLLALAFAIREQKRLLVRANDASGFSAVHSSLARLAVLLIKNDWGVIMESAGVGLASSLLLAWRKIFPSACLILGAFIIPHLPGVKDSAELVLSTRVMLIATAVLYLALPADAPATSKLLEGLGKSLR